MDSNSTALAVTSWQRRVALISTVVASSGDIVRLLVRITICLEVRSVFLTVQSSRAMFLAKSRDWETITSLFGARTGAVLL